jgi:hypothetical protein
MFCDLLNVFLKKPYSFQSLVLGYLNEFVCKQPKIFLAIQANDDAVPALRPPVSALSRPTCFANSLTLGCGGGAPHAGELCRPAD